MIELEKGALSLYLEPQLETAEIYYLIGRNYHDYIDNRKDFKDVIDIVSKCNYMKSYYQNKSDYKFKDIRKIIKIYNNICD